MTSVDNNHHSRATTNPSSPQISVELTPRQVNQIISRGVERGNIAAIRYGMTDILEMLSHRPDLLDSSRVSRSLVIGLLLIAALPSDGTYAKTTDLAQVLNLTPSTASRYLTTLVEVGLAEQHPGTRRYRTVRRP